MHRHRQHRDKQAGRVLRRFEGDFVHVLFPDRGAKPLRPFIRHHQHHPRDGYGSHYNGRHKLG